MTDLADQNAVSGKQNPAQQDQNPAPPWVAPTSPPTSSQATSSSPAIEPTIEPIIQEKHSSPPSPPETTSEKTKAPPQEPATTPTVYNPDDKGKKILKAGGIVLVMFFLSFLTYLSLNLIDKNKAEKLASETSTSSEAETPVQLPAEPVEPPPPNVERVGEFALSVNDKTISWEDYEEILNFHYEYWKTDTTTSEFKEYIKEILTERLIIIAEAERLSTTINSDDLKAAEKSYFGHRLTKGQKAYPEIQKILQTEAYKNKLSIEVLTSWRSGGYILIQFAGQDAEEVAEQHQQEAKEYFGEKIESLYQKALADTNISSLIEEIRKDEEIMKANTGVIQSTVFTKHIKGEPINNRLPWPDPQFEEIIFSLQADEISSIFILKHPINIDENEWIEYGFMFIKVTEAKDANYESFEDWLSQVVSQAEIISNI